MDPRQIDADVAGCAAAHQRLLADLADLTDDQARQPSLLPDWTVGHVLAHLVGNAEGITRMVEAAARGEVADQYPGGFASRNQEIEDNAGLPAADLVAAVRRSIYALETAFVTCTGEGWAGTGRGVVVAEIPVAQMPRRRWREVVIHQSDLGLGFTPADWSAEFVRTELAEMTRTWKSRRPMGMTDLPPEALELPPHERLAWLVGRRSIDGVADAGLMA